MKYQTVKRYCCICHTETPPYEDYGNDTDTPVGFLRIPVYHKNRYLPMVCIECYRELKKYFYRKLSDRLSNVFDDLT